MNKILFSCYNTHIVFTGRDECVVHHCLNFLFIIDTSEIYFFISFKLHVCICVLCCDFANNSHFHIYFFTSPVYQKKIVISIRRISKYIFSVYSIFFSVFLICDNHQLCVLYRTCVIIIKS